MNERIRQLSNQAYDDLVNQTGNIVVFDEDFQQRFAELIVQDCLTICDEVQCQYGQYTFTATTVKDRVIQHFGVES